MPQVNLLGQKIGLWTILEKACGSSGPTRWKVQCACGKITFKSTHDLHLKSTKKGCMSCVRMQHGGSTTPEYVIYQAMLQRCTNPKHTKWARYGGRGITVCLEWTESFERFRSDMGLRPSSTHWIERKDNNKGYSKENCCWLERRRQQHNRSNSHKITFKGQTKTVTDWAQSLNCSPITLFARLNLPGWTEADALTIPIKRGQKYKGLTA